MENKEFYKNYFDIHYSKNHDLSIDKIQKHSIFLKKFLENTINFDNKNQKILEIGFGAGEFIYFLKENKFTNIEGIDLDPKMVSFCKEKIIKSVYCIDVFDFLEDKINYYDLIYCKDVIEHIPKEKILDFCKIIFNSLNNHGKFIVGTINASGSPYVVLNSRYIDFTHQTNFTEWSLSQVLQMAGFKNLVLKPTTLSFFKKSYIGKIRHIFYTIPSYLIRKLILRFELFGSSPKILHWHITAIGEK